MFTSFHYQWQFSISPCKSFSQIIFSRDWSILVGSVDAFYHTFVVWMSKEGNWLSNRLPLSLIHWYQHPVWLEAPNNIHNVQKTCTHVHTLKNHKITMKHKNQQRLQKNDHGNLELYGNMCIVTRHSLWQGICLLSTSAWVPPSWPVQHQRYKVRQCIPHWNILPVGLVQTLHSHANSNVLKCMNL